MFKVMKKGLLTSVQEPVGRRGHLSIGFPPAGAMDSLALTIGNMLVGNDQNEAGLEFAFTGPELLFLDDALVAVTGLPIRGTIDGDPMPMWQAVPVKKGQTLSLCSPAEKGQWGYISISGGIDVPLVMGSKSTLVSSGIGGFQGRMLKDGDELACGASQSLDFAGKKLLGRHIPVITEPMVVELMYGYYYDYLTDSDIETMFSATWEVQPQSNRVGYRLGGPKFEFSPKALNKGTEAGAAPSNIFDTGYPICSINVCGDTPIIATYEAPPCGGYFCPFVIPSAAQWKIGQCRIGAHIRFKYVDLDGAARLRDEFDRYLRAECYSL